MKGWPFNNNAGWAVTFATLISVSVVAHVYFMAALASCFLFIVGIHQICLTIKECK